MKVKTAINPKGEVYILIKDIIRLLQADLIDRMKATLPTDYVENLLHRFESLEKKESKE
jgi:hypothetical protein